MVEAKSLIVYIPINIYKIIKCNSKGGVKSSNDAQLLNVQYASRVCVYELEY